MSRQNVEVVRKSFDAYQRGDWERVVRDADPDIEVIQPPDFPDARSYHGHSGLVEVLRWWPSQWERFPCRADGSARRQRRPGDVWVTRQRGRGKGGGVEVVGEVAFVSTFRDGERLDPFSCSLRAAPATARCEHGRRSFAFKYPE
jgi:ketosteroid isomerase-like protein